MLWNEFCRSVSAFMKGFWEDCKISRFIRCIVISPKRIDNITSPFFTTQQAEELLSITSGFHSLEHLDPKVIS